MTTFERYKEDFRQTAARMNVAIDHNDRNRNMAECGRLDVLKDVLLDMGHKVEGRVITDKDSGMHRAIYITIDGESMGNYAGNDKGLFEIFTPEEDSEVTEDKE